MDRSGTDIRVTAVKRSVTLECPSDDEASVVELLVTYSVWFQENGITTSGRTFKCKFLLVKRTACITINSTERTVMPKYCVS